MDLLFILQNTAGHLYWKDRQGRYLGANHRFIKLTGHHCLQEIIGKSDRDLFSEVMSTHKLGLIEETDQRIMNTGLSESLKEEGINTHKEPAFYITKKIPLFNNQGEVEGIMGTSLDITKEMQAELARKEFLENMRHNIRTPLTGIVGFAEILKLEASNERIKNHANLLLNSSYALLELLDGVLESVRISSGEDPILKKKFNLKETIEQVLALNSSISHHKKLNLSLEFDKQLPDVLIGDKRRIHRIIQELVANAVHFTSSGFVKINVHLAKKQAEQVLIQISVHDSGIGIPKEKQKDIYLQFKRLNPAYKGIYKGIGLGLYIVKQFIDELGGEIIVQSAPEQGSCFNCLIPMHIVKPDYHHETLINETKDHKNQIKIFSNNNHSLHSKTNQILIVEDHIVAQTVLKTYLNQINCQVDIADCGQKAIQMWQKKSYDLIFMDIGLPDMEGYEVAKQIRIQEIAKDQHIPIIAVTAHIGEENQQRCTQAGINFIINKPVSFEQCRKIINNINASKKNHDIFNIDHYPLFDLSEALKNTGSKAILIDILTLLIEQSLTEDVQAMNKAYQIKDWDKIKMLAHKVKGAAVYVGTIRMKIACQNMEEYSNTNEHETLERLYQQMIRVIEQSISYIKEKINTKLCDEQ